MVLRLASLSGDKSQVRRSEKGSEKFFSSLLNVEAKCYPAPATMEDSEGFSESSSGSKLISFCHIPNIFIDEFRFMTHSHD